MPSKKAAKIENTTRSTVASAIQINIAFFLSAPLRSFVAIPISIALSQLITTSINRIFKSIANPVGVNKL